MDEKNKNWNPIILDLLRNRGIGCDEVDEFLALKPKKMYDPFLFHNMEAGVDLIMSEIKSGSKICIYGDYDADGVTSTVIMYEALKNLTDDLGYYIPSRFNEGYGLNKSAIKKIKDDGFDFIITVDCGTTSYEEVEYAKSLGLRILVTDHHSINTRKANCLIINPSQEECQYPFRFIAGCAVAFKVVQALVSRGAIDRRVLTESLDLLAIGTIGDVMPLIDENRTFVKYGLRCINTSKRIGLKVLIQKVFNKSNKMNSQNVAFSIVPYINATGRMADAGLAVKLLIEKNQEKATEIVDEIIELNNLRRATQDKALEDCVELIEDEKEAFLFVRADDVHEGIAGIVAGKIKELYNRPVIILTKNNGNLKGTGRSIEGINIYELLSNYEDWFISFGGHAGACGFTISEEKFSRFTKNIVQDTKALVKQNPNIYELSEYIDAVIPLRALTFDFAEELELLEPFGNKNEKPIFKFAEVRIDRIYYMGDNSQHVSFYISQGDTSIRCVLFNKAGEYTELLKKDLLDIIGSVEIQTWKGNQYIQIIVKGIEESYV